MAERVCCSYQNVLSIQNRVCCLYRVSTTKQVDHDDQNQADIPVQRKACREFAERMGWTIVYEEQENGVSGFKVSANDRDKIQLIKEYAEQGKFDILLVFMFDRIGRRAEETAFDVSLDYRSIFYGNHRRKRDSSFYLSCGNHCRCYFAP